ncbi:TrpR like protein, YerC/YecD [Marinicauda salina]|uniref:TrpR like protein, YerC/YecD n=1 Tax=Marinicauda salina TaxID=2135793 RepID=A0A2U2BV75_9PROT|nr:YerC/YecD family TrpR-related protein [Marinicauda salina]PWE17931.1 TrpR like protein, YerC/YecD [Marinicauda salina]
MNARQNTPRGPAGGPADIDALCEALLVLRTADEAKRFLMDLATPGELAALAERWRVALMLDAGEKSYREISAETGVSTTTVTRVARFLSQEPHQGYRLVLDRLRETA